MHGRCELSVRHLVKKSFSIEQLVSKDDSKRGLMPRYKSFSSSYSHSIISISHGIPLTPLYLDGKKRRRRNSRFRRDQRSKCVYTHLRARRRGFMGHPQVPSRALVQPLLATNFGSLCRKTSWSINQRRLYNLWSCHTTSNHESRLKVEERRRIFGCLVRRRRRMGNFRARDKVDSRSATKTCKEMVNSRTRTIKDRREGEAL